MKCDQCKQPMQWVGREITPGHPEIWADGWVCRSTGCSGYGASYHDGAETQWPGMTLMGAGFHLRIQGALYFKNQRTLPR